MKLQRKRKRIRNILPSHLSLIPGTSPYLIRPSATFSKNGEGKRKRILLEKGASPLDCLLVKVWGYKKNGLSENK